MARGTAFWGTEDELDFLIKRLATFRIHRSRKNGKHPSTFWPKLFKEYFRRFRIPHFMREDREDSLRNWFRNRTNRNQTAADIVYISKDKPKKSKSQITKKLKGYTAARRAVRKSIIQLLTGIKGARKKTVYETYAELYQEEFEIGLSDAWKEHKEVESSSPPLQGLSTLERDKYFSETRLRFRKRHLRKEYKLLPDSTKQFCERYRAARPVASEESVANSEEFREKAIKNLLDCTLATLEDLSKSTGYSFFLLGGGPNPSSNNDLDVFCCEKWAKDGAVTFRQSVDDYDLVEEHFRQLLRENSYENSNLAKTSNIHTSKKHESVSSLSNEDDINHHDMGLEEEGSIQDDHFRNERSTTPSGSLPETDGMESDLGPVEVDEDDYLIREGSEMEANYIALTSISVDSDGPLHYAEIAKFDMMSEVELAEEYLSAVQTSNDHDHDVQSDESESLDFRTVAKTENAEDAEDHFDVAEFTNDENWMNTDGEMGVETSDAEKDKHERVSNEKSIMESIYQNAPTTGLLSDSETDKEPVVKGDMSYRDTADIEYDAGYDADVETGAFNGTDDRELEQVIDSNSMTESENPSLSGSESSFVSNTGIKILPTAGCIDISASDNYHLLYFIKNIPSGELENYPASLFVPEKQNSLLFGSPDRSGNTLLVDAALNKLDPITDDTTDSSRLTTPLHNAQPSLPYNDLSSLTPLSSDDDNTREVFSSPLTPLSCRDSECRLQLKQPLNIPTAKNSFYIKEAREFIDNALGDITSVLGVFWEHFESLKGNIARAGRLRGEEFMPDELNFFSSNLRFSMLKFPSDPKRFGEIFLEWYTQLQPLWRLKEELRVESPGNRLNNWQLLFNDHNSLPDDGTWESMDVGGESGFLLIIVGAALWWISAKQYSRGRKVSMLAEKAIRDITEVLEMMIIHLEKVKDSGTVGKKRKGIHDRVASGKRRKR